MNFSSVMFNTIKYVLSLFVSYASVKMGWGTFETLTLEQKIFHNQGEL